MLYTLWELEYPGSGARLVQLLINKNFVYFWDFNGPILWMQWSYSYYSFSVAAPAPGTKRTYTYHNENNIQSISLW